MGCGPGFMALALASDFVRVSAQDPSQKMVSVGLQPESGSIDYSVGSAEDMASVPPASVDLAVAGQAAHWFNHDKVWPELARILRPRGSVAYVGYGELAFSAYPRATAIFRELMKGDMGDYWPQPGRSIVEGLLDRVPFPVAPVLNEQTEALLMGVPDLEGGGTPLAERIDEPPPVEGEGWDASTAVRIKRSSGGEWALRRTWDLRQLEDYIRTSSAYHSYAAAHPDDTAKKGRGGAEGDVVERRVAQIADALRHEGVGEGDEVDLEWPLVVMMVKRA